MLCGLEFTINNTIYTEWRFGEVSNQKDKDNGKKGGKIAIAICIIVIIVLLGVVLYLLFGRKEEPLNRNVVVNEDNVEKVLEELDEKESVPVGYYETIMNSTWNFKSGDVPSDNAYVENAESNTNSVYFDLIRTDTEETIYESPILPVGSHLENITLDTDLPAGTYDCVVTYHLLDEEDKSISTLKVTVTVVIEQ